MYALRSGGGWSGGLLIADLGDLQKNLEKCLGIIFWSQEVQVTTAHVLAAHSNHKCTSYLDLFAIANIRKYDDVAEIDSDARNHPPPASRA